MRNCDRIFWFAPSSYFLRLPQWDDGLIWRGYRAWRSTSRNNRRGESTYSWSIEKSVEKWESGVRRFEKWAANESHSTFVFALSFALTVDSQTLQTSRTSHEETITMAYGEWRISSETNNLKPIHLYLRTCLCTICRLIHGILTRTTLTLRLCLLHSIIHPHRDYLRLRIQSCRIPVTQRVRTLDRRSILRAQGWPKYQIELLSKTRHSTLYKDLWRT